MGLLLEEFPDNFFYVAMLTVYRVVQLTHFIVGNLVREFIQGLQTSGWRASISLRMMGTAS